jgi:hypothetical protein
LVEEFCLDMRNQHAMRRELIGDHPAGPGIAIRTRGRSDSGLPTAATLERENS